MKSPTLYFALVVCGLALAAPPAKASVIVWNAPQNISGDTDVATGGALVYAYGFNGTGFTGTTVNGVAFDPFAVSSGNSVTVGSVTLASAANLNGSDTAFGFAGNPAFTALSSQYQALLAAGAFTDAGDPAAPITLTLGGLAIGQPYQVQLFVNDARFDPGLFRSDVIDAGPALRFQNSTTELGQFVSGTFTADAATQVISFRGLSDNPPFPPAVSQINAFQLRAVPEPSSIVLLGCGAGALLVGGVRRRFTRSGATG